MGITTFPSGIDTQLRDKNRTERKSGTYTVVTVTDCAKTFVTNVTTVYTLHATSVGSVYTFVYDGPDGGGQISISPAAADGIAAVGTATVVNKDLINTLATAKKGDYVTVAAGTGATGVTAWHVVAQRGIWAKEA
jgi:hypothetical protein